MCTAISYRQRDHYFGRNLDMVKGYREEITITPKNYVFRFRNGQNIFHHYAMIGMATVVSDYPLYYEATNDKGLSMAGLNFPDNAAYFPRAAGKDNIAPFELIPWVLSQCSTVEEANALLMRVNVWMLPFSREYLLTPLHWLIADRNSSMVVESTYEGLKLYANPAGVLSNNPPFPYHLTNLANYRHLSPKDDYPAFCGVSAYSGGMGALGLPGDYSSASRFIKAAFMRSNSQSHGEESAHVRQFFHLLNAVAMPRGAVESPDGPQVTLYSSCCNTDKGIYYYTTYENSRISAVYLHHENLNADGLITYPVRKFSEVFVQN